MLRNAKQGQEHVAIYWPNMNDAIEQEVKACSTCNTYNRANQKEPLLPHSLPPRSWDKVGADYFSWAANDYLVVVDYLSEVIKVEASQ